MAADRVDERSLVDSHNAGDPDAFGCIVRDHYSALLGHALRRLGDRHASEDAVQETFLRAYLALPRFNGAYHLSGWLHRILDNVCIDEGNRRRRAVAADERASVVLADSEPDVATQFHVPDPALSRALASLPQRQAEAFVLRYVHDLSYRDVAIKTGVSEENARARVHRARLALRRLIIAGSAPLVWFARSVRKTQPAMAEALHVPGDRAAAFVAGMPPVMPPPVAAADHLGLMSKVASAMVAVAVPVATAGGIQASAPPHDAWAGSAAKGVTVGVVGRGGGQGPSSVSRIAAGSPAPSAGAASPGRQAGQPGGVGEPGVPGTARGADEAGGVAGGSAGAGAGDSEGPDTTGSKGESGAETGAEAGTNAKSSASGGTDAASGPSPDQPRPAGSQQSGDGASGTSGPASPKTPPVAGAPGGVVDDEPTITADELRSQARGARQRLTGEAQLVVQRAGLTVPGYIIATVSGGDDRAESFRAPGRLAATFRPAGPARVARRTELRFAGVRTERVAEDAGEGVLVLFTGTYTARTSDITGLARTGRFSAVYWVPGGERGRPSLTITLLVPSGPSDDAPTPVDDTSRADAGEASSSAVVPPPPPPPPPPAPAPPPPPPDTATLSGSEPAPAEPTSSGEPTLTTSSSGDREPAEGSGGAAEAEQ